MAYLLYVYGEVMSVGLYVLALFIVQNFLKKLYSESRVIRCIIFAPIFFFFFFEKIY